MTTPAKSPAGKRVIPKAGETWRWPMNSPRGTGRTVYYTRKLTSVQQAAWLYGDGSKDFLTAFWDKPPPGNLSRTWTLASVVADGKRVL